MAAGERFGNWIGDLGNRFREAVGNWLAGVLAWGIEVFFNVVGKAFAPKVKPLIDTIEKTGEVPEELKPLLEEMKSPTGQIASMLAVSAGGAVVGGAIGKITDALFMRMAYAMNKALHPLILNELQYLTLFRRGDIKVDKLEDYLKKLGIDDDAIVGLLKLYEARLDVASAITAWRRYPEKHGKLIKDLWDQGWDEDRIEAWKDITREFPSLQDVVTFYAREVFEPDMIKRYGLEDELPPYAGTLFEKLGVSEEVAKMYWMAHWQHASWVQVVEMLHRGQLTEEEVYQWYRVVEIPPFWRDRLTAISWNVPTRVDVRRFWDMRTIDEARLREVYGHMGYHGKDLDDYVLWTKVYVAAPDLFARWTKGWITEADVRSELTALGMPEDRVDELIQTKVSSTKAERTTAEKDITKTDIIKGVKTGVITREEGAELLMDLGYDEDEATYVLDINIPVDEEEKVVVKRELTKTDIIKGLKTEVITEEEAKTRLLELRYSPADADFLLTIYKATIKPPEEPRDREASKADIVKAVKKGLITPEEGYLMLQDIGFSPEASEFILAVQAESSPFSPINFAEFKDMTQKWRRAAGMESKPVTEELKKAADEVVRLTDEVKKLSASVRTEEAGLIEGKALPKAATAKRDKLRVALHRAEAELEAAQINYDTLVAKWKHEG